MNNCKTCKHAEFQHTETGRIKRNEPGRCTYPVASPLVPECVAITYSKSGIWSDMGTNCATWTAK